MIIRIQLEFESEENAETILSAISPDNSPLPEGLEIDCVQAGQILNITIDSSRSLESVAATLEDIMSAIDLSLRTSDSVD
ncbi:MAG: KEOPS complex subunit Pcc1 [Candidatus Thorarchaeota archaeon]